MSRQFDWDICPESGLEIQRFAGINDCGVYVDFANLTIGLASFRPVGNYSGIALHATGDSAAATYFDDFAIQY